MASYRITNFKVMAVAGVLLTVGGMCSKWIGFGLYSHVGYVLVGQANAAEKNAPSETSASDDLFIDSEAVRLLRGMGKYLGSAREFSFRSHITYEEVLSNEQKIQYSEVATVEVRRPNMLHVRTSGEERQTQIFYDGTHFTILDLARLVYTKTKVPPLIDEAVDEVFDKYGFSVPIADLIYKDPYLALIENAESGFLVGRPLIGGRPTFHLAFTQKTVDWQIWIEDGSRPLPLKLLITYKNEFGSPQYTATLSSWNLQARLSESFAEFHPPAGSHKIEFLKPSNLPPRN